MKFLSIRDKIRQKGKILLVKYLYHLCTRFLLNSLQANLNRRVEKFVRLRSWNWRNLYCRANILIMVNCWNSLYRFSNRTRKFAAFIPKHENERFNSSSYHDFLLERFEKKRCSINKLSTTELSKVSIFRFSLDFQYNFASSKLLPSIN